jgi:hypothetical protein
MPGYQPTLLNRRPEPTAYQTTPVPFSDTSPHSIWRPFSANARQTPGQASVDSLTSILCKPHNTKEDPPRLSVSASNRLSPRSPLNGSIPNDPNPVFGHSAAPRPAKPATHSPLPQPLPLTSSSSKTSKLRAISKSPRLSGNKIFRTENNGLIDPKFCCLPYERRRLSARVLRVEYSLPAAIQLSASATPPARTPTQLPVQLPTHPCLRKKDFGAE